MTANIQAVVIPHTPAINPVDQSLAWIRFVTEGNCNSICDEVRLEAFDEFVGFTESAI